MNKTTEALKLAEEAILTPYPGIRTSHSDYLAYHERMKKALAAIREALAEHQITTPDVCGEVCARAKLCYGCGKAFDEALADHSGDANEMVAEQLKSNHESHDLYTNADADRPKVICDRNGEVVLCLCKRCGKAERDLAEPCVFEPVKQEPVGVVESSEEWGVAGVLIAGLPIGTKLYAAPVQPVKQEPVAWALSHSLGLEFNSKFPMCESKERAEELARQHLGQVVVTPLYAAPVDAKAIRAEALEEAAKVCEVVGQDKNYHGIAAAIRGLK